ncbi:MAG: hypothetical protein J5626_06225 [Lachnospiraceae bacterium]|nr:hypothetical protein [Lachnospiraceae bacterium]
MAYLFWGFLFAFVNLKLRGEVLGGFFSSYSVGIVPDFVGFILLWKGVSALAPESKVFKKLIPASIVLLFVSVAMYVTDFFKVFAKDNMLMFGVDIVYTAAKLFFCYFVIRAIGDMEIKRNAEFYSSKLFTAWVLVFVFNAWAMIPKPGIALIGSLGIVVATAMFLVRMWDSMKNYKDCLEKNGPVTE